jgi:hypothetical protein
MEQKGGGGVILRCFHWLLNVKLLFQGLLFSQSKINFSGVVNHGTSASLDRVYV